MKTLFALAAVLFPLLTITAHAQNTQAPLPRCYELHFSKGDMGNDYYTNVCDQPIGISLIFPRGGLFAFELAPGKTDGTGHSEKDYNTMGQPSVFVCPLGLRPVDGSGHYVTLHTALYNCKR